MVFMRLVQDREMTEENHDDESTQPAAAAEARPRRSRRKVPEAETELADGQVNPVIAEQALEADADESEGSSSDVDLAVLESLLFGTHHPLTAGRLAELLDLGSTKPIRKAIRQLNEQYE